MEILTYALSGSIEHKDSQGNTGVIKPGTVQVMSAGTGIMHSEANPSQTDVAHFLQIWILPDKKGVAPRYEDLAFPISQNKNRLCLIASPDGAEGSLVIHQDARVYAVALDAGAEVSLDVAEGRGVWVQAAKGEISLGHGFSLAEGGSAGSGMACAGEWTELSAGDGAALQGERKLVIRAETAAQGAAAPSAGAEVLFFDLA